MPFPSVSLQYWLKPVPSGSAQKLPAIHAELTMFGPRLQSRLVLKKLEWLVYSDNTLLVLLKKQL